MTTPQQEPTRGASRCSVVILNQYYVPDVASTGHLLHELASELVRRNFDVRVLTSHPSYGPRETWQEAASNEVLDGVSVHRSWTTRFSKDRLIGRLLNFVTYIVPLQLRMLFSNSRNTYLYTTNPPFLGVIGAFVSLIRRHRYVLLLHDAYPEMAIWVGTIRKGGVIDRVWHAMNRLMYRRAEQTIVLCHAAKKLVCNTYGIAPERVHVVPNWADGGVLVPRAKHETSFAQSNGLVKPFTLLYSGNLGLYYEFETLLAAAERLKDEPFRLVFVGAGGRRAWIAEQIKARGLTNTLLLPYQPFEKLNDSLNACDASLVTIAKGIEGISFPSKLYSALAVGKPIIALSEPHSELRSLIEEHQIGRWFALGDADGLAAGVREMMRSPEPMEQMGRRSRELFERNYTVSASVSHYAEVLLKAAPPTQGNTATAPQVV